MRLYFHWQGMLGDFVNFLLTASPAWREAGERFSSYSAAGRRGRDSGDCSPFYTDCPLSFFTHLTHDSP